MYICLLIEIKNYQNMLLGIVLYISISLGIIKNGIKNRNQVLFQLNRRVTILLRLSKPLVI
jgi:hypothetical protein